MKSKLFYIQLCLTLKLNTLYLGFMWEAGGCTSFFSVKWGLSDTSENSCGYRKHLKVGLGWSRGRVALSNPVFFFLKRLYIKIVSKISAWELLSILRTWVLLILPAFISSFPTPIAGTNMHWLNEWLRRPSVLIIE